jgi:cell division septal protein FtsQ
VSRGRGLPEKERVLPLLAEIPLVHDDEPAFLRPPRRTRARRLRRTRFARAIAATRLLGAVAVGVLLLWAAWLEVMSLEQLAVAQVTVRGSRFLSEGEVRELLGPAVGENILRLDIGALKARLRRSPWVRDAAVSRTLPDTLRVDIQEREPLALAELDRLYLMDAEGVLVDLYGPRTAAFDLPIVRGLSGLDEEARRERALRAGVLLADLAEMGGHVSEVEVEDSGDLRVVLRAGGEVVKLGAPPFREAFATFLDLRADLRERCPEAEYFDLRFRGRIVAKTAAPPPLPQPAPAAPRPPTPGAASPATPLAGTDPAATPDIRYSRR